MSLQGLAAIKRNLALHEAREAERLAARKLIYSWNTSEWQELYNEWELARDKVDELDAQMSAASCT